ncbi:MAG TPA: flagellar biosynthetic protein FliO [Dongiaceae bacterium]|jgi:flagellar biogenesis protein FliO|nr:flagellar biosynthetic protein FliO [Dongiaceae bacterium]
MKPPFHSSLISRCPGGVRRVAGAVILFLTAATGWAATNAVPAASPFAPEPLPNAFPSVLRVAGALALVIGIFLGGVWLYRNWQRLALQRGGRVPRLNILETRSLGGRHAIYVVGYDQERFLLASTPAGVNLLSHLPSATEGETAAPTAPAGHLSFSQALAQVLKGK